MLRTACCAIISDVVRLADGVVAGRDLRVWASGPAGMPIDAGRATLHPGAPVAVGPAAASSGALGHALDELASLVAAGGVTAAGAGVDLGHEFRSARLAGARGDRRDAILAALRVLGVDGADRLGDRAGVLVALFGAAATKRVGAAASAAIRDGRWAALHLASAASDVLGPEQMERVLALAAAPGIDPMPHGTASVLADHLRQVLGNMPGTRRLSLLLDLWDHVCAHQARGVRRERLLAARGRQDRFDDLVLRYQRLVDDQLVADVRAAVGHEPTLAEAARWLPDSWHWRRWLGRTMHDALAATVLLRTAVAVADHGPVDGVCRCRDQIAAAPLLLSSEAAGLAARPVPGLLGIPARPGCYVRQLDDRLRPGVPIDEPATAFITQRLAHAHAYGLVVRQAVEDLLVALRDAGRLDVARHWDCGHLREWRTIAGYTAARPPGEWDQPPVSRDLSPLAERMRDQPDAAPADVETPGDLLWYAELADALAGLHGHAAAVITYGVTLPVCDIDPDAPAPDPLRPRPDSIPLAVAGAAQLVSLGAELPRRPRTWTDLVDGLLAGTAVAEALTGAFPVPAPLASRDGRTVPGTGGRLELARGPHTLTEWAAYMGNCIAGPDYLDAAADGRCVLAALRDPDGRILVNLELVPRRTAAGGYRIGELRARFNGNPDPALARRLAAWAATIPAAVPRQASQPVRPHSRGRAGPHRRNRLLHGVGEPLDRLAAQALQAPETVDALSVLGGAPALAGVVALRRAATRRLDEAVRDGVAIDRPDLGELWRATGVRPLATAMSRLDPVLRERFDRLELLLADAPLPNGPRRLARLPAVAEARSVDLVARRLRGAIGRLVRGADPILAPAVVRHADTAMLCALVLAVSSAATVRGRRLTRVTTVGAVAVPGFPRSSLVDENGPWRRAWPDAVELGADPEGAGTGYGLVVPTAWLGPGGWPALWSRAARNSRGHPHAAAQAA